MHALIIKKPWIDKIFSYEKIWEIRGSNTKIRGLVGLIESKSGLIIGTCNIIDSLEIDIESYARNINKHCITNLDNLPYKKTYAWVISCPVKFSQPIPYVHPKGAIIWVKVNL